MGTSELRVQLQYPTQVNDFILTEVENGSLVLRPVGRDVGSRVYLELEDLKRARVVLNFLFPKEYYDAIEQMELRNASRALPALRRHSSPLLDYLALSSLPGNLQPAVISYIDVLSATGEWKDAVDVAMRIPIPDSSPQALRRIGKLAFELQENGEAAELDRLQNYITSYETLPREQLEVLMDLGDQWRESGEYLKAYKLYRIIQSNEGPDQIQARLWVAYCSFYLGHKIVPRVFLDTLPDMETSDPGYSLWELIQARIRIENGDFTNAMRMVAEGKMYSSAADPWYPELLHTLAILYGELGLTEASVSAHREVSTLFPNSKWAAESLSILDNNQI
ncbi:tetratricopeptide repeat protein [Cerasicoccus arenae]|uniref:Tetratricopeptide repeat protein n=2 Tax=Cerasicoccus arenae TaxID=424488 RepID=A0A8J3DB60_9BACT|nr:hypothetical protein GCM10007047_15150 [Cerasicoccus arenae]